MAEREIERWITVHGVHVPIYKGESEADVSARIEKQFGEKKDDKPKYRDNLDYSAFVKDPENFARLKQQYLEHRHEKDYDVTKETWYETRHDEEIKHIHDMSIEEAVNTVRVNIPSNVHEGWFRSANSEYKEKLVNSIMQNPGTLNAGYTIGYNNYLASQQIADNNRPMSFNEWLTTPQTMYRGTYGQSAYKADLFSAYTPNKKVAEKFLNESAGGHLETIQVRPIDTWGSYQTTAEEEFLVPAKYLRSMKKS